MNRNLPISSRISVDVQQLFDDLIVVKCNVNNKEFQGILLNTSKSFFGINESRLKSGPEGLSVKETDKGNVSFSCSVERYSYKLDGTGPSIFTRHPVKRHKSPPASGKHVICQKCQSVVTIPDQVEKQVNNNGSDDNSDVGGGRTCSRRKSQAAPKRISNFDTRENFENNHFTNYRTSEVKEKAVADSPIVGIGSNITKITPSSSLLDVKKILKKKKKKDRVKEKPREPEPEAKSSTVKEDPKERVKKRKLEAQSEKVPIKKCKLLEIPYHPQPTQDSGDKSGKPTKHGKDSSRLSKSSDSSKPSMGKTVVSSSKAKHPSREESAGESKTAPPLKSRTEERAVVKDGEKPVKKIKWDNLLEKKLKKKRKADKFSLPVKSDVEPPSRSALPSTTAAPNGEAATRRSKSEAKPRPVAKPADDSSSAGLGDSRAEEEKAEKDIPAPDAEKGPEPEKSAVATLQKLMRSHLVESEPERKRGVDECEVTSLLAETTSSSGPAAEVQAPKRKPPSEAPPDSSLSLKIKINRTPSSDNGGYQCRIVGEENHTVSSSTADLPPVSPSDPGPSTPSVASSEAPPAEAGPGEMAPSGTVEERLVERCTMHRGEVFAVGDVVWAKITGYPWWPARINVIRQSERVEAQERVVTHTAEVLWFNWDQISYISCEKLFHFLNHYKVKCDKKRKGTYRNAVEQAWMAAQAAQSIAQDDEEDEEEELKLDSFGRSLMLSSSNSTPSQVSSSSTPVLRHAPSSTALTEAQAAAVSSTGVKEGVGTADASSLPSSHSNPAHSHEPHRRESSDDDSESGLVIDTELAGLGSV